MRAALIAVVWVCYVVVSMLLRGWSLHVMWGWFIAPLGVPPLETLHAIGVSLVAGMLTHQVGYEHEESDRQSLVRLSTSLLWPVFAVFMGWIVRGAMTP